MKAKFFLAVFFISLTAISFGQRFSIQPGILNFSLDPQKVESQVIKITNVSDKPIAFQAYFGDWLRDSTGGHQYFKPDTLPRSCANWITLNKNFIEIPAHQTEELLVVMRGPADSAAFNKMKWAMLFLEAAQEKDAADGKSKEVKTEIKEVMRVGVHIYQTPSMVTKVAAQATSLLPVVTAPGTYQFNVQNKGEVMVQCKAYLTLTDIATAKEFKLDKVEFPMFPEGKRSVQFKIPDTLPKGKYSALAVLDLGEEETLQAIEKTIEVR